MLVLDERPPDGTLGSCRTNIRPEPIMRGKPSVLICGLRRAGLWRQLLVPACGCYVTLAGEQYILTAM